MEAFFTSNMLFMMFGAAAPTWHCEWENGTRSVGECEFYDSCPNVTYDEDLQSLMTEVRSSDLIDVYLRDN
jgi:hypothetical protein